jgi:hypothetical protein
MTTPAYQSLIDEQVSELPEHLAVPSDRVLMVFKGLTMADALHQARLASIENVNAWSGRACVCGLWTLCYQVKA